jgi:hypothetical protein
VHVPSVLLLERRQLYCRPTTADKKARHFVPAVDGYEGARARRTLHVIGTAEQPMVQSTTRHLQTSHIDSKNRVVYATCSTSGTGRGAEGRASNLLHARTEEIHKSETWPVFSADW